MRTIAHRGCADQYPENTLRAIQKSAPHVDLIEVDVRRCATGELVLFHDEDLKRVTGEDGTVPETTWPELSRLDVLGSGERVPRLRDALERWPDSVGVNLDLLQPGIGADALALAFESDLDVLVSTTERAVVEECLSADRSATVGLSFAADPRANVERASGLGCDFVHVPYPFCTDEFVRLVHDRDLRVDAWTVESKSTVDSLRAVGVDAVTVDRWNIV